MFCRLMTTTAAIVSALLAFALAATRVEAASEIRSVPPAEYRGNGVVHKASQLLSTRAPAHRIELKAPNAAEAASMKSYNAATAAGPDSKGHPLAIGFGRELPAAARTIPLSELTWIAAPDGGRTARIEIVSAGAAALRVALVAPAAHPDLSVRFAGSAANATVFGDYPVNAIAYESLRSGVFWSPVLAGDTATIEFHAAADAPIADVTFYIPRISHQLVTGADLLSPSSIVMKATGIGAAGACEVDIACVTPASPPMLNLAKAVAKLQFVGADARSYLCSGALLNDSTQSFTPYLYSANHCLESARIARTLNTFWFFDAATCNSKATPQYVQLTGGATLLGRSPDRDWSIVRLLDAPPAGVQFAAWRAEAVPIGTAVATTHHPEGDLKKWSVGASTDDVLIDDDYVYGNFTEIVWNSGVTEPGSSGGPLVTLAASGTFYEIRAIRRAGLLRNPRRPVRGSVFLQRTEGAGLLFRIAIGIARDAAILDAGCGQSARLCRSHRVLQRDSRPLFPVDESGRDQQSRHRRDGGLGAHGVALPRIRQSRAGHQSGMPFLPRARVWRFPFLFGKSDGMCGDRGRASGGLDLRESEHVLRAAARCGDGRMPGCHQARVPVFPLGDDESSLHDGGHRAQRARRIGRLDGGRLRSRALLSDHVRSGAVTRRCALIERRAPT